MHIPALVGAFNSATQPSTGKAKNDSLRTILGVPGYTLQVCVVSNSGHSLGPKSSGTPAALRQWSGSPLAAASPHANSVVPRQGFYSVAIVWKGSESATGVFVDLSMSIEH